MQNVQHITGQIPIPPAPASRVGEILHLIEGLPGDSELILHGYSWDDYSELMDALVEPVGLRIAFDGSTLQIMTLSSTHEKLSALTEAMIRLLSLRLDIDVEAFGSTTVKMSKEMKGLEPDACYYVQRANEIGGRSEIDFAIDPVPDLAIEIDVHNVSLDKLPIYAALGFPEVWRFAGTNFEFYKLDNGAYVPIETSVALPMLTPEILSAFLNRGRDEKQNAVLRDFEAWLGELRN